MQSSGTRVNYRVGDRDGGWSRNYSITTPPARGQVRDQPLVIATYGDMGTYIPLGYRVCEQIANDSKALPLDLIIHQGK